MGFNFAQLALGGQCFFGSTAIAGVVPTTSTTAQVFGLWNPAGSGYNALLNKFNISVTTANTALVASLGLSVLTPTGASIGTPISAFTSGTIQNALLGSGKASAMRFTPSAATTTATTFLTALGVAQTAGTAPIGPQAYVYDFDGSIILPPNTAVFVVASAAVASAFAMALSWAEVPVS